VINELCSAVDQRWHSLEAQLREDVKSNRHVDADEI
jgi:hypothetical protein